MKPIRHFFLGKRLVTFVTLLVNLFLFSSGRSKFTKHTPSTFKAKHREREREREIKRERERENGASSRIGKEEEG